MRVQDHKLVDAPDGIQLSYQWDDHPHRVMKRPKGIIIHYAVTHDATETANVLSAIKYECHLTIDSDGDVIQQVPFNYQARHAGPSKWTWMNKDGLQVTRERCNEFTIGIEISNPGPVFKRNGRWEDINKRPWKGGVYHGRHRNKALKWDNWAQYSPTELDLCGHLCTLLCQTYPSIEFVAGHDEVAPRRKFDPGPAFPMKWLRERVLFG